MAKLFEDALSKVIFKILCWILYSKHIHDAHVRIFHLFKSSNLFCKSIGEWYNEQSHKDIHIEYLQSKDQKYNIIYTFSKLKNQFKFSFIINF